MPGRTGSGKGSATLGRTMPISLFADIGFSLKLTANETG